MSLEHASPEPEPEPEMNEIEAAIGSLVPARSRIDRDRVLFRAGQASIRPTPKSGRRAWMAIAASLALVASGEGVLLARRPPTEIVERVIVVREPAVPPIVPSVERIASPAPSRPGSFLGLGQTAHDRMAEQVLRYGLDGLPRSASVAVSWGDSEPRDVSSRQQLLDEIRKTLNLGDPS
jgi:hypothetical protein